MVSRLLLPARVATAVRERMAVRGCRLPSGKRGSGAVANCSTRENDSDMSVSSCSAQRRDTYSTPILQAQPGNRPDYDQPGGQPPAAHLQAPGGLQKACRPVE